MRQAPGPTRQSPPAQGSSQPSSRVLMEPQEAFAQLSRLVVGEQPLGQVLARVADLAQACTPGAEEVSVSLLEGDKARSAAFTGRLAVNLDERQYETGFGPCLDAAQSGQTIRINDTSSEDTYPDFATTALREGVLNTVSVGMPLPQRILGGINVYRFTDPPLDDDAVQLLQVFAGFAAIALANHSLYSSAVTLSSHLQAAMQSRAVIEQAKGVLAGSLHCSPEDAFQHLVKQSQQTNRKLRDVAAEVVERAGRP